MATLTVENYVKAIFQITAESGEGVVATGELARRLSVSPGSVTSMFRTLDESGLAVYQAYEGVRLTEAGGRLALRVLRRHRLIELFLVKTLGLTWDEVHAEAEHLEHAVSESLIDRMDEYLHFPDRDPHGDPIPRSDGSLKKDTAQPLSQLAQASDFVLERVVDQTPEFLRYLTEMGMEIGKQAKVLEHHPHSGALVVETGSRRIILGVDAAHKLLVTAR